MKASDLIGRFTKSHNTPASRRVPSLTSTSLESSVSDIGAGDAALATSTQFAISSSNASSIPTSSLQSNNAPGTSTSTSVEPRLSGTSTPADLRHRGATDEVYDSSSSEDEAYESPEEFIDAEENIEIDSPLPDTADSPLTAPTAAFTPEDAAKLAVPVAQDTELQADLRQIWYAISLFLNSHFAEAQAICAKHKEDRLYYSLGSATLHSIQAMMSFEPDELAGAVEDCKRCLQIADKERNNWPTAGGRGLSWSERIAGGYGSLARGSSLTVEIAQRMTNVQRHAELAYAECLLM